MAVVEIERSRLSDRRTSTRRSRVAAALLILGCVGAIGCSAETYGIDAYPGSSLGPGHRADNEGYLYLQQVYWTPDAYLDVVRFYEAYTAKEPGWEGESNSSFAMWTRNMRVPELGAGEPLDPMQPGGAIFIIEEPNRTLIKTYASYPQES